MNKCLVLFVEGETEVEFYKKLISEAHTLRDDGRFDTRIEARCVGGIGNFKSDALRKFSKEIIPKYGTDYEYTVVLCRDTDVFEFSPNPPVDWKKLEENLKTAGASKVIHIGARHSIEDWFMYDFANIVSFLRLPQRTSIPTAKNGYEKLKKLYSMANKMYYKGMKSNGMISKLDFSVIVPNIRTEIEPLYKALGISIK